MVKRCIFHVPNYIDPKAKSGSHLRPMKMLQAFKNNGYQVECIIGYGAKRKKEILKIKRKILQGIKFDFVYSESSTMPTILTEKNHFPRYPHLDFGFLEFCRSHNIKVGIFYRDIQWKFDIYLKNVSWYKKMISIPAYKYDLHTYESLADVFYLPTFEMAEYLGEYKKLLDKMQVLGPGSTYNKVIIEERKKYYETWDKQSLNIFYVGGITKTYNLEKFLAAIQKMENVRATICCRYEEWNMYGQKYRQLMTDRITIVHTSGNELEKYYSKADICCVFAGIEEYMQMAMPIKVFEYLGHVTPILSTEGTVAGRFVKENGIGWSVEYSETALQDCLNNILENPHEVLEKHQKALQIISKNTWEARALKVANDLM